MNREEIQREITKLEKKLEKCIEKRNNAKSDIKNLMLFTDKLKETKRAYERGVETVLSSAKRSSSKLSKYNKYKERYNSDLSQIVKGAEMTNAIDSLEVASIKSKRATMDNDEEYEKYNRTIEELQNAINSLKNMINSGGA